LAKDGAEKLIAANFFIEAMNHTMDHGLVKRIGQQDAVADDRFLAPVVPAHVRSPVFCRAKAEFGIAARHEPVRWPHGSLESAGLAADTKDCLVRSTWCARLAAVSFDGDRRNCILITP
jgi:hypothetical protein